MFVNMPALVAGAADRDALVLGTTAGLHVAGIYSGFRRPNDGQQEMVQQAIWDAKAGIYRLADQVVQLANNAGSIIAGCTEIPLILNQAILPLTAKVYDPAQIVADWLRRYAAGLVGVIGGMGIEAGLLFEQALRAAGIQTIRSDQEHPCRIAYLEGRGESPVSSIVQAGQALQARGAAYLVMACNTAYSLYPELEGVL